MYSLRQKIVMTILSGSMIILGGGITMRQTVAITLFP